jgi:mannose-6-phosphate isomerase-like protein (cupin superfamily)
VGRASAQVLGPGEGRSLAPAAGAAVSLKSAAEETDGGWTLFEYTAPPRFAGPPPHWHARIEEAFFVLEGTVRFELGGETVDVGAGGYARVPPGVVHRFSNPSVGRSRFLGLAVPGGLEKYLEELSEMMANEPVWPPADMAPVLALMGRYDTFPPPAPDAGG